jgi:antagonist of KipI
LGNRAYLSIKNGFRIKPWLGSGGTNLKAKIGGFDGRKLQNGDRIFFSSGFQVPGSKIQIPGSGLNFKISNSVIPFYSAFPTVRAVESAEFVQLTAPGRKIFTEENFMVTQNSDRMGFRLKGAGLELEKPKEMVSSAVNFGTIQLLPDGQLIVLMADHQTSGGYPRIANVISMDLPLLAQLGTNDKVAFHLISIDAAENLRVKFENDLNFLKTGLKFR